MNKIVLSFLYLCNIVATLLFGFSLIAAAINDSIGDFISLFLIIECSVLIITLIYVIIYSKKNKE